MRGAAERRRRCELRGSTALLALSVLACGGDSLVVAGSRGRTSPDPDAPSAPTPVQNVTILPSSDCPTSLEERRERDDCWPTRHVGRWTGYFTGWPRYVATRGETLEFPLGRVALEIEEEGAATIAFGAGPAPEPPRDASDPYLCSGARGGECPAARGLAEHFVYGLGRVEVFDARRGPPEVLGELGPVIPESLSFTVAVAQAWEGWCALQTPRAQSCGCAAECSGDSDECYAVAVPADASGPCELRDDEGVHAVDCSWLAAQRDAPCRCDASGCAARGTSLSFTLGMSDDGNALRGAYGPDAYLELVRVTPP